jgi:hypothetical protein
LLALEARSAVLLQQLLASFLYFATLVVEPRLQKLTPFGCHIDELAGVCRHES